MFADIGSSPYDLRFQIRDIPVRVTPWFWVGAVVLGYSNVHLGLSYLISWVAVVFVSILVHELGHAATARYFGAPAQIVMYQFGGLAYHGPLGRNARLRSIVVLICGPLAGFLLFGLVWALNESVIRDWRHQLEPGVSHLIGATIRQLTFVNLWWGVLNLLPVLPLDGGQICREICEWLHLHRGALIATWISMIVAFGVAVLLYQWGFVYATVLFALLGVESLSAIQQWGRQW